jgi:outer membrane protein assembly factor BamB
MAVFASRSGRPVVRVLLVAVAHAVAAVASAVAQPGADAPPPRADEPRLAATDGDDDDREEPAIGEDGGVFLPADRGKERQLDRARRLVESGNWTDAAVLLDELLADERDAFAQAAGARAAATCRSLRTEASRMIETLPGPGREAYALLFRSRAERALAEALADDDMAGVAVVARRWLSTPAGHRAAVIAAVIALESGDPRAATAWLDRVAVSADAPRFEPALTLMRAVALSRAGERQAADALIRAMRAGAAIARVGGRDVGLSADGAAATLLDRLAGVQEQSRREKGEWRQPGGDAARNAVSDASRPLLVSRYRVPLTRHPEEARLLDKRRRAAAAEGDTTMPAGGPLAIAGTIVVHTPAGILGVDFETGKRLWIRSAVDATAVASAGSDTALLAGLGRVFDDSTSGGLSSDGTLVFAVESHPDALTPPSSLAVETRLGMVGATGWRGGNVLTAYDVTAQAAVRWRLQPAGDAPASWHMGAPLVVGDELFVLVEESERVRLDVLDAATGIVRWSQPLADLDEEQSAAHPEAYARRLAGLTPALGEGVLVCPLGGGTVVAVDLATRTLLWAHRYPTTAPASGDVGGFGPRGRGVSADQRTSALGRSRDAHPVIAAGRVLLTPYDSDDLICLGLRDGMPAWPAATGRLQMAGVVDGRVIAVGAEGVEALAVETGRRVWQRPHAVGAKPSGHGILTGSSLFLPLDTPEVVEVRLADGAVVGRRAARGGAVPGNLVAYRGEVISGGYDAIDVFHQADELESRIETALRKEPDRPWAAYWRGQQELDGGDVAVGLARLRQSATAFGPRIPPAAFTEALVFGLRRDFPAASKEWQTWSEAADPSAASPDVVRVAVDGFLKAGEVAAAWRAFRGMLAADDQPDRRPLIDDPSDPSLEVLPDRWIRGRFAEIVSRASETVRADIAARASDIVAAAIAVPEPQRRLRRLHDVIDRLGDHPMAEPARRAVVAELDRRIETAGDIGRHWEIRRDLLTIESPLAGDGRTGDLAGADAGMAAWPLGRVDVRRQSGEPLPETGSVGSQVVPLPLVGARQPMVPGISVAYDIQHRRLLVTDGCGRRLVEPLAIDAGGSGSAMPWVSQGFPIEPSVLGRVLFVRTAGGVSAFDLAAAAGESRTLWRHVTRQEPARDLVLVRPASGPMGRVARHGGIALGRRITEPDDVSTPSSVQVAPAHAAGVIAVAAGSVAVLDPASGQVLWERHGLPPVVEWIGDEEILCGCTVDGRGSPVLSMRDGRLMHTADVPQRRQRLATHGRRIVTLVPLDGGAVAERVRIDIVDPVDREARSVGEFSGESRAAMIGFEQLAVVEPSGDFSVIDLPAGGVAVRARLTDLPAKPHSLYVAAWQDRYLAFVGGDEKEVSSEAEDGILSPLHGILMSGETAPPMSGAVWAIDRADGRLLWPVPATVRRHCLHLAQPTELPVLVFCRQSRARGDGGRPWLSLLCLDKRTGHAVFEEDRIPVKPHLFVGCEVAGDSVDHTITIRGANGTTRPITLQFTAAPMPPRPPFQAEGRPPSFRWALEGLEQSLEFPAAAADR